jgi:hypothetical protein
MTVSASATTLSEGASEMHDAKAPMLSMKEYLAKNFIQ